jgi:putative transcriptional regulator
MQRGMTEAVKSLKGQLLLDNGKLRGSFFHRTVVLVCQHDAEGAFGLVLNRSTNNKVADALSADLPDTFKEEPLYLGGPVQPQALSYLHSDNYLPDANVIPSLNVGHSLETLIELAASFSSTQRIRVFAGYAGWSPGQLDDEMKRDTWLVHPASIDLIFDHSPEKLWQSILGNKGWKYRLLGEAPEDLSWN